MHVIIIQWWMIKLLKTIFVCVQYHWKSITEMHIASLDPVVFSVQTGVVLHKRIVVSADSKVYGRRKKVGINILCRESRDQKRKSNWPFFLEYLGEKGRGVSKFYIFPAHWNCTKTGVVKNRGPHSTQKVVILTTFWSLAAPEVVIRTTSGATSDEKVVNMTTFLFSVLT